MKRVVMYAACLSAASLVFAAGVADSQPPVPGIVNEAVLVGSIDAVTVYRGQALVTRAVEVAGGTGLRELVVTGLPDAIVAGSLYAESADGVEVRSVSFRVRPVGEDSRQQVRDAQRAVQEAQDAFDAANAKLGFLQWQRQYLEKLEAFVAPTAQAELKSGVLNAETLSKLTDMVTSQHRTQNDENQKLSVEMRLLREALELRKRELGVLTASTSRTAREAVVFLNITRPGATLRLTYLVDGANWSPSYNLRAGAPGAKTAKLEYQASVQQMSGEDWSNVQLTLSTATPALVATGPSLMPLTVALSAPSEGGVALLLKEKGYTDAKRELAAKQRDLEQNRNIAGNRAQVAGMARMEQRADAAQVAGGQVTLSLDDGLNSVANESEILDLVSSTKVVRRGKDDEVVIRQGNEGVSVSYKVQGRTSMPSRADQQLIQIASLELAAELHKAATPTLTQYIYNDASIVNTSDMVLLAGPTSSYVGGEFVGSSGIPTIAAGESFRAGFGIDTSLRSSKELVERTESTQGGNRIIEFTYRLSVENFGKAAAAVRLLDRVPNPKDPGIKLTLVAQTPSLSDDKDYVETDRKQNLLRWDVSVPAGATGTKALQVEYKFRLEFDKQMMVTEGR